MSSNHKTITAEDELTIVKLLAGDHSIGFVATATRNSEAAVRAAGEEHGYPDSARLRQAAQRLAAAIDEDERATAITPAPARVGAVPEQPAKEVERPRTSSKPATRKVNPKAPAPAATPAPVPAPSDLPELAELADLERLLAQADLSDQARTRSLAKRVRELVDELRARVEHEAAERRQREETEKAAADALAEVERLREALEQAQERARQLTKRGPSKPAKPAGRDYDPKVVRAWAIDTGYPCSLHGKVPQHVVEAWRKAVNARAAA